MLRKIAIKKVRVWLAFIMLASGAVSIVSAEPLKANSSVEVSSTQRSITLLIGEFVDAWNLHDAKKISEIFAVDGDFIGITGSKWDSPAKIYEVHSALFKGRYDKSIYSVSGTPEIMPIGENIAVAHWTWSIKDVRDSKGNVLPPYSGIFTWILINNGSNWKVRSAQNNVMTPSQ
ncbi:SgcJ/EcaC family oxidoreductase [Pseudomonas fluorescens]|uniref:SgcJ/EcaC family oxidoreductase n=1 Tax=Pseudomonas fluorescens TaxID=294 RepID=UPI000B5B5D86|nr:SgcJ/EcaC family oxidoreductase [Pseudomonas fluorescens]